MCGQWLTRREIGTNQRTKSEYAFRVLHRMIETFTAVQQRSPRDYYAISGLISLSYPSTPLERTYNYCGTPKRRAMHAQTMIRDPAVRSALRRLIRAKNAAFRNDAEMLRVANQTLREQVQQHRDVAVEKRDQLLSEMEEATSFLSHNVVQAPLNERGNYSFDATRINEGSSRS